MLMTHIHAENEGKVGSQDRVETSSGRTRGR